MVDLFSVGTISFSKRNISVLGAQHGKITPNLLKKRMFVRVVGSSTQSKG